MNEFRSLTEDEELLLNKMLGVDFPGRDELLGQVKGLQARVFDAGDNYGSLELTATQGIPASVEQRVPVDGSAQDKDGIRVDVLLHVVDGKLDELEFVKVDGSDIIEHPPVSDYLITPR